MWLGLHQTWPWQNYRQLHKEPGAIQAIKGFSDSGHSAVSDPADPNSHETPTTVEGNGGVSFKWRQYDTRTGYAAQPSLNAAFKFVDLGKGRDRCQERG
jgi:hypothetical protein